MRKPTPALLELQQKHSERVWEYCAADECGQTRRENTELHTILASREEEIAGLKAEIAKLKREARETRAGIRAYAKAISAPKPEEPLILFGQNTDNPRLGETS